MDPEPLTLEDVIMADAGDAEKSSEQDDVEEDGEDENGENPGSKSELPVDSQGLPVKKTVAQIMKDKKRQTQMTLQW